MRIPVVGGRSGRLAKLAAVPVMGAILAACTEQVNTNKTGDDAAPNLFGETSNGIGFPHEVVTTEGIASAGLYLPIFLIAVAIFILVEGILLYVILRYRKRSTGTDLPEQTHGHNTLEIVWTAIPSAIVLGLFVLSTSVLMNDVEAKTEEPAVVVDVIAQSFGWTFDYQEWDEAAGEYVSTGVQKFGRTAPPSTEDPAPEGFDPYLPVGEPVRVRLSTKEGDVIHSFYVPSFFFKRDAIPGRTSEFEFTIETPGSYGGQCAEFCGLSHSQMFFTIHAVEPAEYDAWLAEQMGATAGAEAEATDEGEAEATDEGEAEATDEGEAEATDEAREEAA